jgi:hypothetical protein
MRYEISSDRGYGAGSGIGDQSRGGIESGPSICGGSQSSVSASRSGRVARDQFSAYGAGGCKRTGWGVYGGDSSGSAHGCGSGSGARPFFAAPGRAGAAGRERMGASEVPAEVSGNAFVLRTFNIKLCRPEHSMPMLK